MATTIAKRTADFAVRHLVIGGGVVGLAVAARLSREPGSTLVLEKNKRIGEETSSRNSEVIHAGLYYPKDSFKTRLCIEGKHKLYALCEKYDIPYRRLGKWIVGQSEHDMEYLHDMKAKTDSLGIPTEFITEEQIRREEPHVRAKLALVSPTTGIIDSHALMQFLESQIRQLNSDNDIVLQTRVHSITCDPNGGGYLVEIEPGGYLIHADVVVNSAGLYADRVAALVRHPDKELPDFGKMYRLHYVKGRYFGYSGASLVNRLVYPIPEKGLTGLGVHATLDLSGRMRFGPDATYIDSPDDYSVNDQHFESVVAEIHRYLPALNGSKIFPDYAGIRPKLSAPGEGFRDFIIEEESINGLPGFVNLVGIESPGLTSCLSIADLVAEQLLDYQRS